MRFEQHHWIILHSHLVVQLVQLVQIQQQLHVLHILHHNDKGDEKQQNSTVIQINGKLMLVIVFDNIHHHHHHNIHTNPFKTANLIFWSEAVVSVEGASPPLALVALLFVS